MATDGRRPAAPALNDAGAHGGFGAVDPPGNRGEPNAHLKGPVKYFTATLRRPVDAEAAPRESELVTDELSQQLRDELRSFQSLLTEPSLAEALRLLESPSVEELTEQHVREVAEYRPIELAGERFFERAWSRSKEVAAMLGFALLLGTDTVREDLLRLAGSLSGTAS